MASDCPGGTLADFFGLQRGTTYKSKLKGKPGPVLLGLASIQRNGGFRQDNLTTYGGESPDKLLVHAGELFVSLKDVTQAADLLGAAARVPPEVGVGRLTQDTVKLVPNSEDVPIDYLYWVLRAPQIRALCKSWATGTTNLGLARDDFLSIPVPPLTPTRERLSSLLAALEHKIELNRKMNRTLDEIAQAVFHSWFIDFDGVPPDDLVDSDLGPLPAGWSILALDEVADFLNGTACQKHPAVAGEPSLPVIKIRELNQGVTADSDRVTMDLPEKWHVADGDVLFSWSGSLVVKVWTGGRGALNQHLFKVTSAAYPRWFFLFWTQYHLGAFQRIAADRATTMGHIKRHHLSDAKCAVPPPNVLQRFDSTLAPIVDRMVLNDLEASTLRELRDALLPKLISGELRDPEAVEESIGVAS